MARAPAMLLLLLYVHVRLPLIGGQVESSCTEARGSLCLRCPRPRDARSLEAVSALPHLAVADDVPLLDAHMGQLRDPSDPQMLPGIPQCEPYTSQCTRQEAACAVLHYGDECPAPRFGGRAQQLSVLAAVSVAADGDGRFHSTLVSGPGTPALRLTQAVSQPGAIRSFDTASLPAGATARGFSTVVVAGRWVYYIPGCYSTWAGADNLCRTVVRYDTLCSGGGWGEAPCYESVDLASVLLLSFKNKINFGSAVYDGKRYLYLVSGVGDPIKTPVAAFVRFDTHGAGLDDGGSWRLTTNAISRTPSSAGSFTSAVTDGRYLYFMPGPAWAVLLGDAPSSTVESEGRLLRYDTWRDSGDAPGDSSNFWYGWAFFEAGVQLHADCQQFSSAAFDGSRYIYMAPSGHTKIVRYDTKYGVAADDGTQDEFGEPRAYSYVDVVGKHLCAGYHCAVGGDLGKFIVQAAGGYIYMIYTNWAGSIMLKHDTSEPFNEREGWECVCIATIASAAVQYRVDSGTVLPEDAPTVSSFFAGAVTYDGRRYVYLAPGRAAEGPLVRLDTRGGFRDVASWEAVDLAHHSAAVEATAWTMFGGIASDGRHLYTMPNDYLESVYEQEMPNGVTNDYVGALFRIDPHTATPAFELEVASGGAGGGPGGGHGVGVVWSVAAAGGVATVASGDLLSAGVHVIVASFSPQLDATGSSTISLFVDGTDVASMSYPRLSIDPSSADCQWVDGDSSCDQEWGGCSAGVDNGDCASALEYGGGSSCALDSTFWDGDLVDMRIWAREVMAAEASSLTSTWLDHGVAPPALPPPPPPPPPPEPVAEPEETDGSGNTPIAGPVTPVDDDAGGDGGGDGGADGEDGAGGLAMLIPIIAVGGIASGVAAYCVMRSCGKREGRKKSGVSPYDVGEDSTDGANKQEDDFRDVLKQVEAAIAEGADGAGVQGVEQWSVGALKRWLTRSGVPHTDSYERSELMGRVLSRWLKMSAEEKNAAAEAARRENSNEGSAWWRAGEAAGVNGAAGGLGSESADTPAQKSAAKSAKEAFDARADEWFRANGKDAREGRAPPPGAPGSTTTDKNGGNSYAEEAAREREARAEREGRDKVQQQQEEAAAWDKEKARRKESAAEREMAAQAAAAEAAAKRRQEAEWARQKEAQRQRDSGQTAREAELQRQKEQYQRELERRMAMERNEATEKAQKAARDAATARAAAKRKDDERLREQMAQREREAARKRRAAASQPSSSSNAGGGASSYTTSSSTASGAGGGGGGGGGGYGAPSRGTTGPDGIRVGGGERVDPELARKQNERVRELRQAEAKKERDAQDMAGVQRRVDQEVDRWAQAKDLPAMLRTLGHILPGAPAIQTDGGGVKKAYMKALRLVHPDKVDPNASAATKAKAQRIFTTLQTHKP
jgi:hypothetical protein